MSPARSTNGHAYATRYVTMLRSYRLKVIRENGSYRGAKGCCGDGARAAVEMAYERVDD
jgi:hypothetical protein